MTSVTAPTDSRLSQFEVYLKGEPKALGIVQIVIGIMILLFGFVLIGVTISPTIVSGIALWGPIIYISSGSLSVAAANHKNPCAMKASLVMNVISAVAAGLTLILFAVDMLVFDDVLMRWCYNYNYYRCYSSMLIMWHGIYGVLFVFTLLLFIISICTSVFACKASCCFSPTPVYLQPLNLQPVNLQLVNQQPMYSQAMTQQLMYSHAMNPQPLNQQLMNPSSLSPPPMYNSEFYNPEVPQKSPAAEF
ncbi:membrane-spanning 4-domains subfamily A member 4A-like [Silurus meridionalis]|uniref:Membrane-spanning 4-domains subfamily A member 4A-like n=1 Tax=Silurus meridionalis TaxID=175797 RepID=A0A8T0BXD7_SILME|nr:membrane-spanning 4-domains subfamily A member 4A-like [Silurus meridionalis]KAF7711063.1 hypothetical protein HF521_000074 [Silurus meridionalis]